MQIVSYEENLFEMSNSILWGKLRKYFKMSSAKSLTQRAKRSCEDLTIEPFVWLGNKIPECYRSEFIFFAVNQIILRRQFGWSVKANFLGNKRKYMKISSAVCLPSLLNSNAKIRLAIGPFLWLGNKKCQCVQVLNLSFAVNKIKSWLLFSLSLRKQACVAISICIFSFPLVCYVQGYTLK